jgi:hypothetical protein
MIAVRGILILLLAGATLIEAQIDQAEQTRLAKFKSIFLFNFIDYVKWPEERKTGPLVIGITGDSELLPFLEKIALKRRVGKREILIRRHDPTADDPASCHLLFITSSSAGKLDEIIRSIEGKQVLTVSGTDGFGQRGVAINFVLVEGKLKFEINTRALSAARLDMSSQLLKLGILLK